MLGVIPGKGDAIFLFFKNAYLKLWRVRVLAASSFVFGMSVSVCICLRGAATFYLKPKKNVVIGSG